MEITTFILIATAIVGFYMAWNIGANDVANSMASAVGAKAITLRQAVIIAGVLTFVGATFVGTHVTDTVRKGILNPYEMGTPMVVIIAFSSALLGASIWIFIATWKGLPVSTTHSIVGALVGTGLISGGSSIIHWGKIWGIIASWVISPLFSAILAFLVFTVIKKIILQKDKSTLMAKRYSPYFIGITFFIIFMSLFLKTPLGERLQISTSNSVLFSLIGACLTGYIGYSIINILTKMGKIQDVEQIFRVLQVLTSCYVAFAHGSNDVANAIGPLAAIRSIAITGEIGTKVQIPLNLLALGGIGIAIGIFTWGYRVIKTVGFRITELTNTRGFCVDFGTATSVLIASKLGLPVSTTHAAVGAVVGVGLARGFDAVDFGVVKNIVISWLVTLPIAAGISAIIFKLLVIGH